MRLLKRKKKLIDSTLQLRLIATVLCISCITSLFQVVLLNRSLLDLSARLPRTGQVVLAEVPSILLTNVMVTLLVLVPLSFGVGLLATHRIAGPIWRMQRYLDDISERGSSKGLVQLRERDEFQSFAHSLNRAILRLTGGEYLDDNDETETEEASSQQDEDEAA